MWTPMSRRSGSCVWYRQSNVPKQMYVESRDLQGGHRAIPLGSMQQYLCTQRKLSGFMRLCATWWPCLWKRWQCLQIDLSDEATYLWVSSKIHLLKQVFQTISHKLLSFTTFHLLTKFFPITKKLFLQKKDFNKFYVEKKTKKRKTVWRINFIEERNKFHLKKWKMKN